MGRRSRSSALVMRKSRPACLRSTVQAFPGQHAAHRGLADMHQPDPRPAVGQLARSHVRGGQPTAGSEKGAMPRQRSRRSGRRWARTALGGRAVAAPLSRPGRARWGPQPPGTAGPGQPLVATSTTPSSTWPRSPAPAPGAGPAAGGPGGAAQPGADASASYVIYRQHPADCAGQVHHLQAGLHAQGDTRADHFHLLVEVEVVAALPAGKASKASLGRPPVSALAYPAISSAAACLTIARKGL